MHGNLKYSSGFNGTFNGNGHVIRNLKINTGDDVDYVGLFGYTTALFINLGIEGCEITVARAIDDDGALNVGAIAGRAAFYRPDAMRRACRSA